VRGPEALVDALLATAQARLPARLAAIRAELGVDLATLPDVASWHRPRDVNLLPVESFPAVLATLLDTSGVVDEGAGAGGRAYRVRYRVRLYVFARAEGAEGAGRARDRYLLAAREVVLGLARSPAVALGGAPLALRLDPRTYRESHSEVDTLSSASSVAAAYLEAELDLDEVLSA